MSFRWISVATAAATERGRERVCVNEGIDTINFRFIVVYHRTSFKTVIKEMALSFYTHLVSRSDTA